MGDVAGAGDPEAAEVDEARIAALEAALRGAPDDVAGLAQERIGAGASAENRALLQQMRAAALSEAGRHAEALEAAGEAGGHMGWFLRGTILHMAGDGAGSLEAYGRAAGAAEGPRKADMHAHRAMALRHAGRHAEALAAAREALEADPGSADAALLEAASLNALGRHAEAAARAEASPDAPPDVSMAEQRAVALAGAGRDAEALEAADALVLARRAGPGVWYARARLLARAGDAERALDSLTVAVALDPGLAGAARREADFGPAAGSGRLARVTSARPPAGAPAEPAPAAAPATPPAAPRAGGAGPAAAGRAAGDRADWECWAVMAACKAGDYRALLDMVEGELRGRPDGPRAAEYAQFRAELLLADGRPREALAAARWAIAGGSGARGWIARGAAQMALGGHDDALESYREAERLAAGAELGEALAGRARALGGMEMDEECAAAAAAALKLRPGDAGLAVLRSYSLRCLGRHGDALAALAEARDAGAGPEELDAEGAVAAAEAGDTEGALGLAGRALARSPGREYMWYVRARMLARLGRNEEALDSLTVAVLLDPSCIGEAAEEADLDPLKGDARFARIAG